MALNIVCSGHLFRHPLGGLTWHHLQYLVGFRRLGHRVTFFEDWGWPRSCYDPSRAEMTADPAYGIRYMADVFGEHGLDGRWCYLGEDGRAHGLSRAELAAACRDADIYFDLSGVNWIPELEACRRRVLVDTDPVFVQIGKHGIAGPLDRYHVRFTYGENVHRAGCDMPTGGVRWLPTRQPVVLDLWRPTAADASGPFTTVMNWTSFGDHVWEGRTYGQKDREFVPFFSLPHEADAPMELALAGAPDTVRRALEAGGWRLRDAGEVSRTPAAYQRFLEASRAEFSVAKHAYVITRSGWFSDRTSGYLALGRPAIVQDTGFSEQLPCGKGLLPFRTPAEARAAIRELGDDYESHCRAARAVAEECFDAARILSDLLERAL
jgi:hypothetical protein